MKKENEIIVGLDIGTTKICAIVGSINEHGKLDILGIGKTPSHGVIHGVVSNITKTVEAIELAVKEASDRSGVTIRSVYVGIAGQHIRSIQHRGTRTRENPEQEIGREDVDMMIEDMKKLSLPPGEKIIHVIPEEFIVDNLSNISVRNVIGMCGSRMEGNFHVITGQDMHIRTIRKCVEKAGLELAGLMLEPLASSEAVLSEEEKEAGVALIDIGGGTTDIAIFQESILRHTAVIPLGGNIVTEDIKKGCSLLGEVAEKLKVEYGCALALEAHDNERILIKGLKGREPKEISLKTLAKIIEARMAEILEHVYYEIRSSGYESRLIGGIVATGGGAQLRHLPQLIQYVTGLDARIGYPNEHIANAPTDDIKHPLYATGVGLVLKCHQELQEQAGKTTIKDRKKSKEVSWLRALIDKGTKILSDTDNDLE